MRILIAAGGTGGHVYPALAVAEAIHTHYPETKQFFIGSHNGFERPLVEQGGVAFDAHHEVRGGPLHGVNVLKVAASLVQNLIGTVQSIGLIRKYRPNSILLTGGWVSLPVALAGWLMRVPILIFLPDIEPGMAIKVLRPLAQKIAIAIPESSKYFPADQVVVTGYPVRAAIANATREAAIDYFKLDENRKTLLVFGGSQGAQTINTAMIGILPQLLDDGIQVLHITGKLDWKRVCAEMQPHPLYHPYAYLHAEMGLALAAADLVVSRSGAGTLGEFPLFGVPSILVPYPYAWRYQKVNADYLEERGAGIHMVDSDLADKLYITIHKLFTNDEQLITMRQNAMRLAQPDGARWVAVGLMELAGVEPV